MAKQMNQLPRELKQLDAKVIDPSLLYIMELRGRSVNESGTPPLNSLPLAQPKCKIKRITQHQ